MRVLAAVVTVLGLAASGWFGWQLYENAQQGQAGDLTAAAGAPRSETPQPTPAAKAPRAPWPALFGELQPPGMAPPAVKEPEPEAPEVAVGPPLDALGYQLKGVIRVGGEAWGMVSHPTGERILRLGDVLQDELIVTRIDAEGLWVQDRATEGGAPRLLGFADQP
jgi:hypothetical protein